MLFAKAILTFFVAFTICASAAPTGKRAPSRAPTRAVTSKGTLKTTAGHNTKANVRSSGKKMTVKRVKASGNQRLAAVPRDFDDSYFEEIYQRNNPTGANAMTFYRTVGEAAMAEATNLIGQAPVRCGDYKGDFAVDGAFYMFAVKSEAEHVAAEKLQMKTEKRVAVVSLTWVPPPNLRLKRWDTVNDEWRDFTETCNKGGNVRPPIQTSFDFIEGPMSTKTKGKREQLGSYYQYAIPVNAWNTMRQHLTITAVEEVVLP